MVGEDGGWAGGWEAVRTKKHPNVGGSRNPILRDGETENPGRNLGFVALNIGFQCLGI